MRINMNIQSIQGIYVCTAKGQKLNRVYHLITGDELKKQVIDYVSSDLNDKQKGEHDMGVLSGSALIEDIPYYVEMDDIEENSYLYDFKNVITQLINPEGAPPKVLQLKKRGKEKDEIENFEENEGIKFFIIVCRESVYFLHVSRNATIKNTPFLQMSVTKQSTMIQVDRGVKFPQFITARLDRHSNNLFVYDVDYFEAMLMMNENKKEKSKSVVKKFKNGEYKVSKEEYSVKGLDERGVENNLFSSKRAVRRLAKYDEKIEHFEISKIEKAIQKLDAKKQVRIDHDQKVIYVTPESAKTFVGIIHNVIVERLISGKVEIII